MKRFIFILAAASLIAAGSVANSVPPVQVCSWGGTPDAPTGQFSVDKGVTFIPSTEASRFTASGSLAGGGRCSGTMTFRGWLDEGSSCEKAYFHGRVEGLRGVARFSGPGFAILVHEFLYDAKGKIVGADQPLLPVPQPEGFDQADDCASPQGFQHGAFSSRIELWG